MSYPTSDQAASYDRFLPLLKAQHSEFTKLSGKKQDGHVNELKIRNVNRLLQAIEQLVVDSPSRPYLELLDEATLPENSDVVIILSQWLAVLEQYKEDYYGFDPELHDYRWFTQEDPGPERSF